MSTARFTLPNHRRWLTPIWRVFALACTIAMASIASAHQPGESYLNLAVEDFRITGEWDMALRDLDGVIGLDANHDGAVTWEELQARHKAIAAYALKRLKIKVNGIEKEITPTDQKVASHPDGIYSVLVFELAGVAKAHSLEVTYQLFFDAMPQHRGILNLHYQDEDRLAVFSPHRAVQSFDLGEVSMARVFRDFLAEGVWHILTGYDHILFLVALLLPSVLRRGPEGWTAVPAFRPAFYNVVKIVTAFTVAHSITLSLATLGVIQLPPRLVESTIAASVVLAAVNNIRPIFLSRAWMVAFGFGLIHGFGFANVLLDLGLTRSALALTLFSFNLGVEAGQLAIVAIFLPVAYLSRTSWYYHGLTLRTGSAGVALVAATWMVQRILNVEILPF
jgi:hypothetical protein